MISNLFWHSLSQLRYLYFLLCNSMSSFVIFFFVAVKMDQEQLLGGQKTGSRQMSAHLEPGCARGFCLLKGSFFLPLSPSALSWWELLGLCLYYYKEYGLDLCHEKTFVVIWHYINKITFEYKQFCHSKPNIHVQHTGKTINTFYTYLVSLLSCTFSTSDI